MKDFSEAFIAGALLIGANGAADAAVLDVQSGVLVGATGVDVDGTFYDVSFLDGTCASVYGSCSTGSFDFHDQNSAITAAAALLGQVLVDGPDGSFDTKPQLTRGCSSSDNCQIMIAFGIPNSGNFEGSGPNNFASTSDGYFHGYFPLTLNTANSNFFTFAKFSVATVPDVTSWALFISGFGLVGTVMRRRRAAASFV